MDVVWFIALIFQDNTQEKKTAARPYTFYEIIYILSEEDDSEESQ